MVYMNEKKIQVVGKGEFFFGLLFAVHLKRKDIFDCLWRGEKKNRQNQGGPLKVYFAWG